MNKITSGTELKSANSLLYKVYAYMSCPFADTSSRGVEWTYKERLLFRFLFIFFVYFIIPIDIKFYGFLFQSDWQESPFYKLLALARYQPEFFPLQNAEGIPVLGLASFNNWLVGIVVAVLGTLIWTLVDKERKEYVALHQWLQILLRYKLAIVLFAYGVYKLFVLQIPYPSLSNLLTNYGDAFAWKVYYQTTGLSSTYVAILGFIEIIAAVLFFFRKTVTWGAGLTIGYVGNIAVANSFYDIGELSLSTFLILAATFLFALDFQKLYRLLIKEEQVDFKRPDVDFSKTSWRKIRLAIKGGVFVFVVVVLILGFSESNKGFGSYKYPQSLGLADSYGVYDVKEFIVNGDTLPYSNTDSLRWQNVVFEKWATVSLKINKEQTIDKSSADIYQKEDIDRNYELAGFSGRHYYHYEIDGEKSVLHLYNKNRHHREDQFSLQYSRPTDSTIILNGNLNGRDSIKVLLERAEKPYMLFEGRRRDSKL